MYSVVYSTYPFGTRDIPFVPAQEEGGVASMLKDALVTAPQVFSQGKEQFSSAVDSLVRAAQTSGDERDDITTRDILRMAHGIAVASQGDIDARERMLKVMFDGLGQTKHAPESTETPRRMKDAESVRGRF